MIPGESEKHFQKEVIRFCHTLGAPVYFTLRSMGSPSGWPDLVIPYRGVLRIRELKTDTGDLSPAQKVTHAQLKGCERFDVDVWRPRDWLRIVEELTHD